MKPPRKEEPTANIETGVGLKKTLIQSIKGERNSYLDERERTLTVERKRLLQGREKDAGAWSYSLLELRVMFLLYGMNIQCDSF